MAIANKMVLISFLVAVSAHFALAAQTIQDALQALKNKDYQTAQRILRPLAEHGAMQSNFAMEPVGAYFLSSP